jgi:1,4-dihydroxy-2-naphthoyl-CoA hydrolase
MPIWQSLVTLEKINERIKNTLVEYLGIEFLEIGDDFLKARMPVDRRTKQTTGILHGGASVTLAETLGSIAASYCIDRERKRIVGLEINANHIRPASEGWVTGITKPIHIGTTTQIWEIKIYNEQDKLVCVSRLTVANIDT